jgi:hypothetical protein
MGKDEETNEIKLRSDTRRTRRASAGAAGAPTLRERHHYSMFNVDELVKSPFYMDLGI